MGKSQKINNNCRFIKKYFGDEYLDSDYDSNKKLVDYAKAIGKSGVSILADLGAFPYKHRMEELVKYELSLPTKYDIDLKRLCLYHKRDFNRLSEEQKQKLLS